MMFTQCQWIGQGEGCNHSVLEAASYCGHHYPRIYQQGSALKRRAGDQRLASWLVSLETADAELDVEAQDD